MKARRIIVYIAMLAVALTGIFCLSGCDIEGKTEGTKRIEDALIISEDKCFGYHLLTYKNGEKYATLVRLTTEGQEVVKKNGKIYIPLYVHGYPLKDAGVVWYKDIMYGDMNYSLGIPGGMENKLILPYTCEYDANWSGDGRVLYAGFGWHNVAEEPFKSKDTMYVFNYENAPNENRFLRDNLSIGEVLGKLPYDPEREGYDFTGWSRDAEGKQMLTDTDVKEEIEIVLFAQWAKK